MKAAIKREVDLWTTRGLREAYVDAAESKTAAPQRENSTELTAKAKGEIGRLVQQVFSLPKSAKSPSAVAFCGVESGAGCTWVCARSSESLAGQVSGSVCVIDANLKKPSLHVCFGMEMAPGVTQTFADKLAIRQVARRLGDSNLWVVTAGSPKFERSSEPAPASFATLISEARAHFDYVLIDTPSLSLYSEGLVLAKVCDGAILIVGSGSTRRESARIAKEHLDASRVPVLGAVLNRRTFPIPEALYRRM